jgi:inner membrane protein
MLGRTHMLGGVVAWELVAPAVPAPAAVRVVGAAFALWGSLGPDMDHVHSTWSNSFTGGPWIAKRLGRAVGGHRQGTHSLLSIPLSGLIVLGLLLLAEPFIALPQAAPVAWAVAFSVGWTSHILEDMLTVQGVGILYPMTKRRIRVGNLRTSKDRRHLNFGERLVFVTLAATGLLMALSMLGGFIDQTGRHAPLDHGGSAASRIGTLPAQP